jgi:salicylate hydroxylase
MGASDLRVAIVGAGIGGLTLGIALRERGVAAEVFEQTSELSEIGAGVALSANGVRLLARLGMGEELAKVAAEPIELVYRHWQDGHRIAAHPMGLHSSYRNRFGAPFFGIHRTELQRILAQAWGGDRLHLGCRVLGLVEQAGAIALELAGGGVVTADLVVGADGVRSTVRRWVTGDDDFFYSGTSGFRGLVPVDRLPHLPAPRALQFWVGPGAHLVHYPIGVASEVVNFLAVVEGPPQWTHGTWMAPVAADAHLAGFAGWHPAVTEMLTAVPQTVRWGLFAVRPLLRWSRGNVVLLGDAAHAMLPHHGQGANQTIEDAFVLADCLAGATPDDLGAALRRFQVLRRARTRKVQFASRVKNDVLHLPDGPDAQRRDRRLADIPADVAWIHDHDAAQTSVLA